MIRADTDSRKVAFAGNPNVGKSTLFNALTGLRQHTGNWAGKTVDCLCGRFTYDGRDYLAYDLPGCFSVNACSAEEKEASGFLMLGEADAVVVVCDATCLKRSLVLAEQLMEFVPRLVIAVNLMDEARRKGIEVDIGRLSKKLKVPAVGCCARDKAGLDELMAAVDGVCAALPREITGREEHDPEYYVELASDAARDCVKEDLRSDRRDRRIDKILTSKWTGFPIMLLMLAGILYITMTGANYPSQWLGKILFAIEDKLLNWCGASAIPWWLYEPLISGVYRVMAWVVSVMLPPMAIFFPLFTILEDLGYLPRVAFNLDRCFKCSKACGKQALTMCMVDNGMRNGKETPPAWAARSVDLWKITSSFYALEKILCRIKQAYPQNNSKG